MYWGERIESVQKQPGWFCIAESEVTVCRCKLLLRWRERVDRMQKQGRRKQGGLGTRREAIEEVLEKLENHGDGAVEVICVIESLIYLYISHHAIH